MSTIAATNLKNASSGSNNIVLNADGTIGGTCLTQTCRAWVNFNGSGTVAIRASYNVSSIIDGGVGTYTIKFATALPDSDYATTACASSTNPRGATCSFGGEASIVMTTTDLRVVTTTHNSTDNTTADSVYVTVAVFR